MMYRHVSRNNVGPQTSSDFYQVNNKTSSRLFVACDIDDGSVVDGNF